MPSLVWPLPNCLGHGPNIPGSYAILLFIASDFTSITSHIHNWVLFLPWLRLFILSGVISPLICSIILGTYQPGEFIFQCPIFLPFLSKKNTEVVCHSLLQWTTFCQCCNSWGCKESKQDWATEQQLKSIKATCICFHHFLGSFLWNLQAHKLNLFLFLLLVCLGLSLLWVQPQGLKRAKGGNFPLPKNLFSSDFSIF